MNRTLLPLFIVKITESIDLLSCRDILHIAIDSSLLSVMFANRKDPSEQAIMSFYLNVP